MSAYSERFETALALAARAHQSQVRKVDGRPYVTHVVHVATILLRYGFPEDVIVAGLLHDVVEDQDVLIEAIEAEFGPAVSEMVDALTERKVENGEMRPWEDRKKESLVRLSTASDNAVAVKAADVLHNVRSVTEALQREGPTVWNRFRRGPEQSLWYYGRVVAIVQARLGAHPLAVELEDAVHTLTTIQGSEEGQVRA